ncbi:MAG TPA: di-heme oxidoredictase family protein, partial [Steroidobacteraceae bacterium]|nr:di-heme oxidoredictase family protein [Steroidobacteraceae bacterium]
LRRPRRRISRVPAATRAPRGVAGAFTLAVAYRVALALAGTCRVALGLGGTWRVALALAVASRVALAAGGAVTAPAGGPVVGSQIFKDHRNPPAYRQLSDEEFSRYDLGMTVFNTQFVAAGTPNAGRRDGVGPLFNSSSCDACHNNGAHGRGPTDEGPASGALVIQLATPDSTNLTDPDGDPVYGRIFNTIGLDGVPAEGIAMIHYEEKSGHYPDGSAWHLREPHYTFTKLNYGPLAARTIVKPRLAPALFGAGLLDAAHARFGWQGSAVSVRDQTARAFSREMGLTSADIPHDDCTPAEVACLEQPNGGSPEVSDELFAAVLGFELWLAVPASPTPHPTPDTDAKLFAQVGCVACHQPQMTVGIDGAPVKIAPYTDLRLHDLGNRLADKTVAGKTVTSRWRTAPLWGFGYRVSLERFPTFLHDGRARSVEEAILWHDGEAAAARKRFERLPAGQRKALVRWVETL